MKKLYSSVFVVINTYGVNEQLRTSQDQEHLTLYVCAPIAAFMISFSDLTFYSTISPRYLRRYGWFLSI
jgi:hypothetical protein